MRIDSSGNLLVGKNVANSSVAGVQLLPEGDVGVTRDGSHALLLNRLTSDGDIALFRKDGTTVGSIFSYNGFLGIGSPSGNDAYVLMGSDFFAPATSTGAARDGAIDLGSSGRRFKDLYLSNDIAHKDAANNARLLYDKSENLLGNQGTNGSFFSIYLGGSAAANRMDDYEEGTWTPAYTAPSGVATYSVQTGSYTKVGNKVTVIAELQADRNTLSGLIKIGGLPFSSTGTGGGFYPTFAMRFGSDMPNLKGYVSGTEVNLRKQATNATASTTLDETDLSNAGTSYNYLYFTATYFTTA